MSAAVPILVATCLLTGVAIFVLWKLQFRPATLPVTTTWIDEFSVERYLPMLRLLDETELRVLHSHSGTTPQLAARFRRERCRIFRNYLRCLTADFSRVSAALKLLMTQAGTDRPDLASLLIRAQVSFAACLLLVRVQVAFYALGFGRVNAGALLQAFERIRLELRTIVPRTLDTAP